MIYSTLVSVNVMDDFEDTINIFDTLNKAKISTCPVPISDDEPEQSNILIV
jgi:hypothetical protein